MLYSLKHLESSNLRKRECAEASRCKKECRRSACARALRMPVASTPMPTLAPTFALALALALAPEAPPALSAAPAPPALAAPPAPPACSVHPVRARPAFAHGAAVAFPLPRTRAACCARAGKCARTWRLARARGACPLPPECPLLLEPRPVYPPGAGGPGAAGADSAAGPGARAGALQTIAVSPGAPCSCDDLFDLERRVAKLQDHNRDLTRRTLRVEHIMSELLESMQGSDDVALLERHTCSAVVYNEQLTSSRPLRLLREELKRLQKKWSI